MRIVETEYKSVPVDEYTPEEIEDLCCEETDVDPCAKSGEKVESFDQLPKDELSDTLQELITKAETDPLLEVVYASRENPCGEQVTKYGDGKSCCDGVAQLEWDYDESASVLPAGGSAWLAVTSNNGRPLTWITTDNGTWFSNGQKKLITNSLDVQIFSSESFCGSVKIDVSDGCSNVTESINSDQGQWEGDCIAYMWWEPVYGATQALTIWREQDCIWNCTSTGLNDFYVRGLVSNYYWDGNNWVNAQYKFGTPGNCQANTTDFSPVQTWLENLGIPSFQVPDTYAPNGPSDLLNGACSVSSNPCKWVC